MKIAAGMSATQATVETDMEFVVETLQGMLVGGLSGSLGARRIHKRGHD